MHAWLDLVDLHLRTDGSELLLEQLRVLFSGLAGRGDQDVEREPLPRTVADAVAVAVAPAARREQTARLQRVVGELPGLGVPDPPQLRHRTRGDLGEVTEDALTMAVDRARRTSRSPKIGC